MRVASPKILLAPLPRLVYTMDTKKLWKEALGTIKISVSPANFSTWFSHTFIAEFREVDKNRATVVIATPSSYGADTVEKRWFGLVQDSLASLLGKKIDLSFMVKQNPAHKSANLEPLFYRQDEPEQNNVASILQKARLREGFTFENFAVSSTNQMAHAAAEAVCRNPGKAYNPLFLWGGVGVGKTHLMLAIGHKLLSQNPELPTLYCMGDEFTTEIVEAIKNKSTQQFKNRYRRLKLLMVDDVQFIAGKPSVQEEFFNTFNILLRDGGQVVLTADRPPHDIDKLEVRLKSRFEAGLCVDISAPDFELRAAIALIKARERGLRLSMDAAQAIAANIDSPRRIEGFITSLWAQAGPQEEILPDRVTGMLGKTNGEALPLKRVVLPVDFIEAVSQYFSLAKRKLLGENRSRPIVVPRQILMYLLRAELGLPYEEVGHIVGDRDHTTVMHAVGKISRELLENTGLQEDVLGIKRRLSG